MIFVVVWKRFSLVFISLVLVLVEIIVVLIFSFRCKGVDQLCASCCDLGYVYVRGGVVYRLVDFFNYVESIRFKVCC